MQGYEDFNISADTTLTIFDLDKVSFAWQTALLEGMKEISSLLAFLNIPQLSELLLATAFPTAVE